MLEKTLESPVGCKEIQPVHPKGNELWVFIGRTDVEAETPILWPLDVKNWLIGKDPDAWKDWRWEEKGTTEDQMVGWAWVWVNSGSWWRTGRPGMLLPMGHRVRHHWATELTDWTSPWAWEWMTTYLITEANLVLNYAWYFLCIKSITLALVCPETLLKMLY